MRLALAAVFLLALANPAAAKCMQLQLKAQVLTANVEISGEGGGVVVATTGTGMDDKGELPANQASWKLRSGKKLSDPVITTLAPGLVLYGPPPTAKGTGDLVTGKSKVLARWKRTNAKRAALAGPSSASTPTTIIAGT